jgi:hypothetical protein
MLRIAGLNVRKRSLFTIDQARTSHEDVSCPGFNKLG